MNDKKCGRCGASIDGDRIGRIHFDTPPNLVASPGYALCDVCADLVQQVLAGTAVVIGTDATGIEWATLWHKGNTAQHETMVAELIAELVADEDTYARHVQLLRKWRALLCYPT